MIDHIWKDLRYSFRSLMRVPAFTLLSIGILALGIGANSAIFSVFYDVLIKSLPYPEPERIVLVWGTNGRAGTNRDPVSATDTADFRAQNTALEEVTTYTSWRPSLSGGGGETERVSALQVGDGYFKIMKAKPFLGRTFLPEDQTDGKDFVVILTYGLWKRQFAGDPSVIGRVIRLNARQYTVIGVMSQDFHSLPVGLVPAPVELYRPVAEPYNNDERASRHLMAIGRLKSNATLERAQSEMSAIAKRLEKLYPVENTSRGVRLVPFPEEFAGNLKSALYLLAGAAALVLLIACANIANLLLARTTEREREMAIRVSLGAPVSALIRQLLFECLLISVAGCLLGILLSLWGVEALSISGGKVLPQLRDIELSVPVLLFSAGVTIISSLLLGIAPAHHIRTLNLHDALKEGGRVGAGVEKNRLRGLLVISEMALAIILLVGAGLFMRSVLHLYNVDPGFNAEKVITMNLALQGAKYPEPPQRISIYKRIDERVNQLPGIKIAGLSTVLPLSDNFDGRTISIEGQYRDPSEEPDADMYVVTPGYLKTMEISLIQGRMFTDQDSETAPMSVLVSESLAKHFWPNQNPIGRRIRIFPGPNEKTPWRTVVGVVNDVKQYGLNTTPPLQFYVPNTQFGAYSMTLVAKTTGEPSAYASSIRKAILELDPEQAAFDVATLKEVLGTSIGLQRFSMILLVSFAVLALCLASAGIYAVISYVTSRRTHEIGIRMALGAQQQHVLRMILRQGLILAGTGAIAGLLAAAALTRLVSSMLFNVNPTDPLTYVTIAALLIGIALLASGVPALRATKVDPMIALRYE
jgi:putative ABC transport system permease protein